MKMNPPLRDEVTDFSMMRFKIYICKRKRYKDMEASNVQVSMPKGDLPFLRKIAKGMGWTVTTPKKTGLEAGLEDIEAGRVFHAANATEMIAQILG